MVLVLERWHPVTVHLFGLAFPDALFDPVQGCVCRINGGFVLLADLLVYYGAVVLQREALVVVNRDFDLGG